MTTTTKPSSRGTPRRSLLTSATATLLALAAAAFTATSGATALRTNPGSTANGANNLINAVAPVDPHHPLRVLARRQTAGTITITLAADPGQNGGQGINQLRCDNGKLTATVNLQVSTNVNGIHDYQPMGETGLPTIDMSFFVNGNPAKGPLAAPSTFNVGKSEVVQNNVWRFTLCDDCPHPGGIIQFDSCTQGAALPAVSAAFATTSFINGQGLPNGADGGPPVPAVSGVPTLVNKLPAAFVAANGGGGNAAPNPQPATTTTTAAAAQQQQTTTGNPAGGPSTVFTTVFVTSTVTVQPTQPPTTTTTTTTAAGNNLGGVGSTTTTTVFTTVFTTVTVPAPTATPTGTGAGAGTGTGGGAGAVGNAGGNNAGANAGAGGAAAGAAGAGATATTTGAPTITTVTITVAPTVSLIVVTV
ncbi:hypothetical protein DFJ73DRAFT_781119 [Zopfochytrium polystomum]|nr:hypothetical protein DFJ73DRAFT_781119 [Zopfochytrium polystomum]